MKLQIVFEPHDALPPKVYDGFKRNLVAVMENWGIPATVTENRIAEMEAYQAWFAWNEARIAGGE